MALLGFAEKSIFWRRTIIFPLIGITVFIMVGLLLSDLSESFTDQEIELELVPSKGTDKPPIFAYMISGTGGEGKKMLRLLKAVYHPRNRYLLRLDAGSTAAERTHLARSVRSQSPFRAFRNVHVTGKSYAVDRTGASAVAATLHGAAVLLRNSGDWDWFIALSASDYPIVTQDDLLHAFTSLPRDLNFIDITNDHGPKEFERFGKIVADPSLYMEKNTPSFFATGKREIPDAFTLFTGSPWMVLTRSFLEHCVHGWDNLPRKLLMYFSNVPDPIEAYFQTVICNTPEFRNTTVNSDLSYYLRQDPTSRLEPTFLNRSHCESMLESGAAFARKFVEGEEVLQMVDEEVLMRAHNGVTRGKWCAGSAGREEDPCRRWGDIDAVEPGKWGVRLRSSVTKIVSEGLRSNRCKFC